MIFQVDHRTVTEGDVVEITWRCNDAESVLLTIDNGFKTTDIPLETSGTKRFRLNRSKGRTHLKLSVTVMGKSYSKTLAVKVKKIPTVKAEPVDSHGNPMSRLKLWWQNQLPKWRGAIAKFNMAIRALPEKKQLAIKMLSIISILLILSSIWPSIYHFVMFAIILYLMVILLKR